MKSMNFAKVDGMGLVARVHPESVNRLRVNAL